jgi:hypothetical protein
MVALPPLLRTYAQCATVASKALVRNPLLLAMFLLGHIAFFLLAILCSQLGLAGQFVLGIVSLIAICMAYSVTIAASDKSRLTWRSALTIDWFLFQRIVNAAFPIWLASLLLQLAVPAEGGQWIIACFNVLVLFVCNPLPELIMSGSSLEGMDAVRTSVEFMKARLVEWLIPILILWVPAFAFLNTTSLLLQVAGAEFLYPPRVVLLPALTGVQMGAGLGPLAIQVLFAICSPWILIFRRELFDRLTSARSRLASGNTWIH